MSTSSPPGSGRTSLFSPTAPGFQLAALERIVPSGRFLRNRWRTSPSWSPFADGVKVFHPEAERIHLLMARSAGEVLTVLAPSARGANRASFFPSSPSSSSTFGGGGGGVPSYCSITHLPRFTGEVRVGFEVIANTLACVSHASRVANPPNSTR